jgi:hypothetical protein
MVQFPGGAMYAATMLGADRATVVVPTRPPPVI